MTFGDMGSYEILNPYDVPYLSLKFVPLITNPPVYVPIKPAANLYQILK